MKKKILVAFAELRDLEAVTNKYEKLMMEHFEDDSYEEEFDKAYTAEWKQTEIVVSLIEELTKGMIDKKEIRTMLRLDRPQIIAIINKWDGK